MQENNTALIKKAYNSTEVPNALAISRFGKHCPGEYLQKDEANLSPCLKK